MYAFFPICWYSESATVTRLEEFDRRISDVTYVQYGLANDLLIEDQTMKCRNVGKEPLP